MSDLEGGPAPLQAASKGGVGRSRRKPAAAAPPADRPAVAAVLHRLGQLAADLPELQEIEINPLRVLEAGAGAYAVDVRARLAEGCLSVEMEAASLMAVAEFRGAVLGQVVYGGDDLSGPEWDSRSWQGRKEVRENLFWLAAEACLEI
jgi:hypothetical protein